jgi:hypothetical protein
MPEVNLYTEDLWEPRASGRLLLYVGPHLRENLDSRKVTAMVNGRGAWGAMWSFDWDRSEEGPWYSYVCDTVDYDLDKIESSNTRYKVRRCLKACDIRPIDFPWLAEHGYETYRNAVSRYANYAPVSEEHFRRTTAALVRRPRLSAYGAFAGDRLAAFGVLCDCGRTIRVSTTKFDPNFSEIRPMYGLYYVMARDSLRAGRYQYIDNGTRPLMHETDMWEFLRRLGWRKAYERLGLYLTGRLSLALRLARASKPLWRGLLPGRHRSILEGLLTAQDIAGETSDRLIPHAHG